MSSGWQKEGQLWFQPALHAKQLSGGHCQVGEFTFVILEVWVQFSSSSLYKAFMGHKQYMTRTEILYRV